ncbi:MAG: glycosyltransferase family 4 protein [Gemmataceae bacterium]
MTRLRLLFVKQSQNWPRSSGHDVHGYHMVQALIARGHAVSLACVDAPTPEALSGLNLESRHALRSEDSASRLIDVWSAWQRRFTNYFGVTDSLSGSLDSILQREPFDAVIVVARHLLPLLAVVKRGVRIWYPADDPAWHHLTRLKLLRPGTWPEAKRALANGLFERAFRQCFDRVWVVSPADRRAMRLITGCPKVDLIPNGVDADHYRPQAGETIPNSCCFWGRLDFGPNVDALAWFLRKVWPAVKRDHPAAAFHVFGFNPTAKVRELAKTSGVELFPDLPDLRSEVTRRQAVVLPFISGGGIKNKLLEAAALGMPVVCTAKALSGTKGEAAVKVANRPREWSAMLGALWSDSAARASLGAAAREWVMANHSWDAAAATAEAACGFATRDS